MYRLAYSKQSVRQLARMPAPLARRIRDRMAAIAQNPYAEHANVKRLRGRQGFRLRVGDWRVIYDIRDDELVVLVLSVAPRGQVYR